MKSLMIAMDYDNTFSADPSLWADFIAIAQQRKHTVLCVTARHRSPTDYKEIKDAFKSHGIDIPIYFTEMGSKIQYMLDQGVKISVWIDDDPRAVIIGH